MNCPASQGRRAPEGAFEIQWGRTVHASPLICCDRFKIHLSLRGICNPTQLSIRIFNPKKVIPLFVHVLVPATLSPCGLADSEIRISHCAGFGNPSQHDTSSPKDSEIRIPHCAGFQIRAAKRRVGSRIHEMTLQGAFSAISSKIPSASSPHGIHGNRTRNNGTGILLTVLSFIPNLFHYLCNVYI